jgi:putative ABC transport system ATP-binding protein
MENAIVEYPSKQMRFDSSPQAGQGIRLDNVRKEFNGTRKFTVLDDINLDIARGEMVSIVGPSGSGKSTLLNLIGTLDRPTSGSIRLDGQSIDSLDEPALTRLRRDKIGFIFQFFNLLVSLSSLENVGLPLHLRGWPARKVSERARVLLELVGLGHRINHVPDELSGGERQRVAIARALACNPPILLADEPTGNLDSVTGAGILDTICELHHRFASTVVLVTHDDGVAARAPRRITLRDACIVEDERA